MLTIMVRRVRGKTVKNGFMVCELGCAGCAGCAGVIVNCSAFFENIIFLFFFFSV